MSRWEKARDLAGHTYTTQVHEGFILTKGNTHFAFKAPEKLGLVGDLHFPTFQLLKVHQKHPIQITSVRGALNIRPIGDKRPIGSIALDPDRTVYDAAHFLIVPWDVQDVSDYWEKIAVLNDAFHSTQNNENGPVSILYSGKRGLEIDKTDTWLWSVIHPPQINRQFFDWAYRTRKFDYYDKSSGKANEWKPAGVIAPCIDDTRSLTAAVTELLEARFRTRISHEDRV